MLEIARSKKPAAVRFSKAVFGVETGDFDFEPPLADLAWLRRHGRLFGVRVCVGPGARRQCYKNASDFVWEAPDRQYVQGFVLSGGRVYAHAWALEADGTAVETTWGQPRGAYFGVPFPLSKLVALHLRDETYDWHLSSWIC